MLLLSFQAPHVSSTLLSTSKTIRPRSSLSTLSSAAYPAPMTFSSILVIECPEKDVEAYFLLCLDHLLTGMSLGVKMKGKTR